MMNRAALGGLCLLILPALFCAAQAPTPDTRTVALPENSDRNVVPAPGYTRLQQGLEFYRQSRWQEAVAELRRSQAEALDPELKAEALYWIALSEIAARDYAGAIQDMDQLELVAPASKRLRDIPYHKGRVLYYLGRYEESLLLLKLYADSIGGDASIPAGSEGAARKSAALYWIGECLYAMGQLDYARDIFTIITRDYFRSAKFEAASYRLALIQQKKIEEELLNLLKWSHEESLKAIEEYQRRERSYDQALIAYQRRIADLLKDSRLEELDNANAQFRRQLMEAEEQIRQLELELLQYRPSPVGSEPRPENEVEHRRRLEAIRSFASDLVDTLQGYIEGGNPPGPDF
ncbi:MAG: tetratricopeptide repeat protein [Treponema sp.]|jgi:tetratricopeptide (TPR) repeat protein|nr:tetratricopeptide repeat protein [Treponema sp.]